MREYQNYSSIIMKFLKNLLSSSSMKTFSELASKNKLKKIFKEKPGISKEAKSHLNKICTVLEAHFLINLQNISKKKKITIEDVKAIKESLKNDKEQ